jgi:hypothetical protein
VLTVLSVSVATNSNQPRPKGMSLPAWARPRSLRSSRTEDVRLSVGMIAVKKEKALKLVEASGPFEEYPGDDLRSHTVARAVSSARRGLTSVFGMGTGVTLAV